MAILQHLEEVELQGDLQGLDPFVLEGEEVEALVRVGEDVAVLGVFPEEVDDLGGEGHFAKQQAERL